MNAINRVTEFYVQASRLRMEIQSIRKLFGQVFQIALNSSLMAGKVDVGNPSADVYKTESKLLGKIASEMDREVQEILEQANDLTKISLTATTVHSLATNLELGLGRTHGERNQQILRDAIRTQEERVEEAMGLVRTYRIKLKHNREEIQKLIRKIWVTKNSIEAEARSDQNNKVFSGLAQELEVIVEAAEEGLKNMDRCFYRMDQLYQG